MVGRKQAASRNRKRQGKRFFPKASKKNTALADNLNFRLTLGLQGNTFVLV